MSFQQSTATALPAEVQLAKEKPQGAFCLRTRYALSANSANSWLAGSLVSLPLQTGTPGTFTDVKQGNINCTVQISNTNPYVDYVNFGPCGAMILFDEMRVYSSGTPVEENLRYSETVDLLMEQGGWQCRPMHVFRRNKWRANNGKAGDKHINFIKPSMVDVTGTPMFGRTPFMDNNSAVYNPATIAFGYQPNSGTLNPTIDKGLITASKAGIVSGTVIYFFGSVFGTDSGYTFNDDGYGFNDQFEQYGIGSSYSWATAGFGSNSVACYGRNSTHVAPNLSGNQINVQINDHLAWKNTLVGRGETTQALEVTYPWLPCATYSPAQWPDYQPCTLSGEVDDYEVDQIIGKTKVSEYMKYLSNVRSLPIGVSGTISGTYGLPVQAMTPATVANVNANNCSFTEYRVSMPFVSGIYGILADKMFPDLLIGANNIRIEFKLASNNKALWLTMDPCRRVPGTVRDFAPFTGAANGAHRFGVVQSSLGGGCFAANDPNGAGTIDAAAASLGCTYAMLFNDRSISGGTAGLNVVTTLIPYSATNGSAITPGSFVYNTPSTMGEDLVPTQPLIEFGENILSAFNTITASLDGNQVLTVTATSGLIKIGQFINHPTTSAKLAILEQTTGSPLGGLGTYVCGSEGTDAFASQVLTIYGANNMFMGHANPARGGYSLNTKTNLPKPQYMPCANPWVQKEASSTVIATYCNERSACYGTYLPSSVAQTRRCQNTSRLDIAGDPFASNGATAFAIRDLQVRGFAPYNPLFCCAKH